MVTVQRYALQIWRHIWLTALLRFSYGICFKNRMSGGYDVLMDIDGNKVDFNNLPKGYETPKLCLCKRISARRNQLLCVTKKTNYSLSSHGIRVRTKPRRFSRSKFDKNQIEKTAIFIKINGEKMITLNEIYSFARCIKENESKISKYHYIGYYYNKNFKIFDINNLSILLENNKLSDLPQNLIEFVNSEKQVMFIPNIIDGCIVEIICRSTKNKRFINISSGKPSMFYNIGCLPSERRFSDPIIVCEGTADCEYIKNNINKNVLACLTDSISVLKMEVLRTLTNHVILSFDNDDSGKEAEKREMFKLKRLGFFVEKMHPQPWYKDYGDMILLQC